MGFKEKKLLNQIQIYFTSIGSRIFRNNIALSYTGSKFIKDGARSLIILDPRPIRSGLATGSSDLIGWTTTTVTQEMVGKTIAVFTAVECKTGKLKLTTEQENFLNVVNKSGGIGIEARSVDDVINRIRLVSNDGRKKTK